ncbi:MAG: hypothetical protein JW781_05600 [Deltaproteobacteria bacterium]|nr:hypothetical protein [Candidatus Anaeroferrophillacea bacterium]
MRKETAVGRWRRLPLPGGVLLFLLFSVAAAVAEVPLEPGISMYTTLNPVTFRNYAIDLPNCTSRFQVRISEGSGDLDLFIRYGQPFTATSYDEMIQQSDVYSDTPGTAYEFIELNATTTVPIRGGRWYVAPTNWNDAATGFLLATYYEVGMPVPAGQELFLTYEPIDDPVPGIVPSAVLPIAVGDTAWGGGTLTIEIGTCPCVAPVDLYFAVQLPSQPEELYLLLPDGLLYPYSLVGLLPWKSGLTAAVDEIPFGDLSRAALPPGTYYLYLAAAPVGTFNYFYLWSTFFSVSGPSAPGNIDPFIDLIVDDTVIDFGRLDEWRRNLGVGTAIGIPPDHPWPVPPYTAGIRNLCTYINGGISYLKTIPQLPVTDPNHINPQQYPAGITCVYAVVADGDVDALNVTHMLPEPLFGRGNYYTAIDIPGGVPAGTLIDNYATMSAYNATLTACANAGQLGVQPHARSVNSPFGPGVLLAPVEPLRTPPQEFPYVIAFSQVGAAGTTAVLPGQTLRESPNPLDPVALQPFGTVFQVTIEEGAWSEGNARGYIWMVPVTDDFWDPRHSGGSGDPALWVGQERVGTLTYVGQTLPVIWEAPDDPDVPTNSTHDQRHIDPDTVPLGGVVQLEGQVQDPVNPMVNAFAPVSYPVPLNGGPSTDKITIGGGSGTYS